MGNTIFRPSGRLGSLLHAHEESWVGRILAEEPNLFGAFRDREGNTLFKTMWHGEFPGKLLSGTALMYAMTGSEAARHTGDALAAALKETQAADGYLGPWDHARRFDGSTEPDHTRWQDGHDIGRWDTWGQYHCIYGLYRWYKLTGDRGCLETAMRALDCIYDHFIAQNRSFVRQNWAECNLAIGHAFALLYRECGKPEYLQAAKHIVHTEWDAEYSDYYTRRRLCCGWLTAAESGVPFGCSGQPRWEGVYSLQTLAELYRATGEDRYRDAACALWRDIAATDRHNTGSFGTGEGATGDLYGTGSETCNTVAWMAFSTDVLQLTNDSRIADELELSWFNAALGSLLAGERDFTYMNDSDGSRLPANIVLKEQSYDGARDMSCCQANGTRGIAQPADWAMLCEENGLWLNWYSEAQFTWAASQKNTVRLTLHSGYPADGQIRIELHMDAPSYFALHLRIPGWSAHTSLTVNGIPCTGLQPGSYCTLDRRWRPGDVIELALDLTPHFWPYAEGNRFSAYCGPVLLAYRTQEREPLQFTPDAFAAAKPADADALTALQVCAADGMPMLFTDYYSAGKDGSSFASWLAAAGPLPAPAEPIWQSR